MKQLLLIILAVLLVVFVTTQKDRNNSPSSGIISPPTPDLNPSPTPDLSELAIGDRIYRYYFQKINSTDSINLVPNFTSPQTSSAIIKDNNCSYGINGGFYLPDNKPLGLFYQNGKTLNSLVSSSTFNGYLAQGHTGQLSIKSIRNIPTDTLNYRFILQSGPLFNLDSPTPNYSDPEYARRHLIAQDKNNTFYLFSIFEKERRYGGPRLADIPAIFNHSQLQSIAPFVSVLNLDGGSASAFYNGQNKVEELTFVGSFICFTSL